MKKSAVSLLCLLALLCIVPSALHAEEQKLTGSATLSLFSQYVFRGYELSKNSLVIQPSVTLSYYGFSANVWGNFDIDQHETQSFFPRETGNSRWNETDLTLSYTHSFGKWNLTGGYIWYGTVYAKQTQEVFVSVGYDIITKPVFSIYQDISRYGGTYFQLAFSHSQPVYDKITLDLGASFSYMWGQSNYWKTYSQWSEDYTGGRYSAFHTGMVTAGFTIPVTKNFSIQPVTQFWFPLSGKAQRRIYGNPLNPSGNVDYTIVYGLNTTFTF
jgi:hypothetical protein